MWLRAALLMGLAALLVACEVDSYMDPSIVGRWERTPVTMPILDRLDVIDEPARTQMEITGVRAEDLVPDVREYVIGPSDVITISIFELLRPGEEAVQTRRVDEMGRIRLPEIGTVQAGGLSPSELEQRIQQVLEAEQIVRDTNVSVILQQARQRTYSVIGEPRQGGTAVGTYNIPEPDFRLLDALALARGVPGRTKSLLIYRQTPLTDEAAGEIEPYERPVPEEDVTEESPDRTLELLDRALEENDEDGEAPDPTAPREQEQQQAPEDIGRGLDDAAGPGSGWVFVGGEWVRAEEQRRPARRPRVDEEALERQLDEMVTQRIIEIPYQDLLEGDMRYNVVIRPGDVIRVPAPDAGFVYIMGEINRPGAYTVPGETELTLKQLVASAGNLSALAIPERVDLIRRVDDERETYVRLNLRAIFDGTEPDVFLKPNDLINVGTSFPATPLAIIRNGFRATYGFGFILDRNFGPDVFD